MDWIIPTINFVLCILGAGGGGVWAWWFWSGLAPESNWVNARAIMLGLLGAAVATALGFQTFMRFFAMMGAFANACGL